MDIHDDPYFVAGRKFLVTNKGRSFVKTCLGAKVLSDEDGPYRVIFWDDGTISDSRKLKVLPKPFEKKEVWEEAVRNLSKLLSGEIGSFRMKLLDGIQLEAKVKPLKYAPEGRYYVIVTLRSGEIRKGWVDFKPHEGAINLIQYIKERMMTITGEEVIKIEVKKTEVKKGGKRWLGIFFSR